MAGEGVNLGTAVGYIEIRDNVDEATRRAQTAFDRAIQGMSGKMKSVGDQMTKVGTSIGLLITPLIAFGGFAVKASIQFETAFASVEKTVGGSQEELDKLRETLRDMAVSEGPIGSLSDSLMSLTTIAGVAGSLGVPVENIAQFAETVALLAAASDDLNPDEAATFIGHFRNITGMNFSQVGKLADVVVTLGNNMATTEGQLAGFAKRIAPLATYNWKPDTILAYSAALASLGVSPELGGTNLMKSVIDMNMAVAAGGEPLEAFAEAAGMAVDEFVALANADPEGAFRKFIEGLSQMDATRQLQTLSKLGVTAVEQVSTLQRLAGGYDLLVEAIESSEDAWKNGGAAIEEATKKAGTTEGVLSRLNNHFMDMKISIGNTLTPAISSLAEKLIPLVDGFKRWAEENPETVQTIAAVAVAIGGVSLALVAGGMIISNAAIVFGALGTAIGLVNLPLMLLIGAIGLLVVTANALLPGIVESWRYAFEQIGIFIQNVIRKIDELLQKIGEAVRSIPGMRESSSERNQGIFEENFLPQLTPGGEAPVTFTPGGGIPGFARGGYTGDGPANQLAGLVHNQEWVFNKRQMGALLGGGGRKIADTIIVNASGRQEGYAAADAFGEETEYQLRMQRA